MSGSIKSFTDLNTWKKGHALVLLLYKETKGFPSDEQYGLTSQIRRSGVSFTSNLAEGFSRGTYKDKVRFYQMALGSLTELQNQLLIALDLSYVKRGIFNDLAEQTVTLSKMTNGLIKKSKSMTHNS